MVMRWSRMLGSALCIWLSAAVAASAADSIHQFDLDAIEGGPLPLAQFEGRPILLVNTASFCGFTYQYEQLQTLWDDYGGRGLVVLGVPSNDFGRQEPGQAEDIQEFCEVNFAITFPMSDKIVVKGPKSHPLFTYLRAELGADAGPHWNFNKYLIDADGIPQAHWPSSVKPDDIAILDEIEALLAGS